MYIKKSNQCKFNCLELCTDIAISNNSLKVG